MMTGPSVRRSPSVRKGSSSEGGSEGEEGPCQPASLVHFWRRQTSAPDPQARGVARVIARREENEKEEEAAKVTDKEMNTQRCQYLYFYIKAPTPCQAHITHTLRL